MEPNLISDTCMTLVETNTLAHKFSSSSSIAVIDVTYIYDMIDRLFKIYPDYMRERIVRIIIEDMVLEYSYDPMGEGGPFIENIIAIVEYDFDIDHILEKPDDTKTIIEIMQEHENYLDKLYAQLYGILSHINNGPYSVISTKIIPVRWNVVDAPGTPKFKAHLNIYSHPQTSLEIL